MLPPVGTRVNLGPMPPGGSGEDGLGEPSAAYRHLPRHVLGISALGASRSAWTGSTVMRRDLHRRGIGGILAAAVHPPRPANGTTGRISTACVAARPAVDSGQEVLAL